MAVIRDIEPWDALLEAGRTDERLVMQSAQHARRRARRRSPMPCTRGRRRPAGARDREAVGASGGGTARRLGGADDRHDRNRVGQVAVLQPAHARRAVPRRAGAGDLPLSGQGARPGPGAGGPALGVDRARPAIYDGDTPREQRSGSAGARTSSSPTRTCCTWGSCPTTRRGPTFFANLAVVVVDEAHVYRGVFGSHVANVLRRLRRVAAAYGTEPRFLLTSATIANPGELAERLTGLEEVTIVERDGAPRARRTIAMWNPPVTDEKLGTRRSALAEAADLLADLVCEGARTIVFMKSRKAVELMARFAQLALEDRGRADLAERIAPYRAGYTPSSGASSSAASWRASCSAWSRPTRSSSASTSARWTPRCA